MREKCRGACMLEGLEVDELVHAHVEGAGNATQHVDANVGRSLLNLPEIGTARAGHKGELALRYAALVSRRFDMGAEARLLLRVVHVRKRRFAIMVGGSL